MSLKTVGLSIVIGSMFTGAKAFASSSYAITKLDASIKKLSDYKTTLKVDTKEFAVAIKETQLLEGAIKKLKINASKLDEINVGRDKFKSKIMETTAMGAVAIAPIKMAVDFETSFVGIQKVVDFNNNGEMNKMRADIISMSTVLPVSAAGLSEIAAAMGGIGLAKKDILGATKAVAIMSTAFDMSAQSAGDSMGKLMNVYGLSVKEVMAVGDTINAVDAGTAAKAKLTVEVLGRIGGASKAMGLSAHSAAGLAGAFLDLGVAPEVAGTGINALLSKMMTADKQGAKFQNGLKAIGMDAKGMKDAIAKDASGAVNNLMNSLAKLPKEKQMGVLVDMFGTEYADDIALVVGGIDRYNKATSIAANTTKNAGSMQAEFEKQSKTTANQMKLLSGSVTAIGINIGSVLLPAVNFLVGGLKRGSDIVGKFASQHETATKIVGGLTVSIIGGTVALSVLGYVASFATGGMIRLSSAYIWTTLSIKRFALWVRLGSISLALKSIGTKIATASVWLYSTSLKAARVSLMIFSGAASFAGRAILWMGRALFANPIGIAIAAIAGGAYLIYRNWEPIKAWFAGLWSSIKITASSMWEGLKVVFGWTPLGMIMNNWVPITSFFQSMVSSISMPFVTFFTWIESKFKTVSTMVSKVGSVLGLSVPEISATPAKGKQPAQKEKGFFDKIGGFFSSDEPAPLGTANNLHKPTINALPKQAGKTNSNNVVININNPKIDTKEQANSLKNQILKEVTAAMAKINNDKKDRSFAS